MANAWPPQFKPDSIRYSDTQSPRLARNFPCTAAEWKSLTFSTIFFLSRPCSSGKKSGNSAAYEYRRGFMPAENTIDEVSALWAKPRKAADASLNWGANFSPSR